MYLFTDLLIPTLTLEVAILEHRVDDDVCRFDLRIDELVENIQKKIYNSLEQEVSSKKIGEMVMEGLKEIDEVAYVRYASVYRSFKDLSSFMAELKQMMKAEMKTFFIILE